MQLPDKFKAINTENRTTIDFVKVGNGAYEDYEATWGEGLSKCTITYPAESVVRYFREGYLAMIEEVEEEKMKLPEVFKFVYVASTGDEEDTVYTATKVGSDYHITWENCYTPSDYNEKDVERNVNCGSWRILPETFEEVESCDFNPEPIPAEEKFDLSLEDIQKFSAETGAVVSITPTGFVVIWQHSSPVGAKDSAELLEIMYATRILAKALDR